MPLPEDLFRSLGQPRYLSKLDLRSGFYQLPLHPDDCCKTAFWWRKRLFQFTRMPFGLRNATAAFQRVVDQELRRAGLTGCAKVFVDDILIHSDTFEDHVRHVEAVLQCLQRCRLRAHPRKSTFGCERVEYLGHLVTTDGLEPLAAKVAAMAQLPAPSGVPQLRAVLGLLNYYRHFIPNFSATAKPLTQLLQQGVRWEWGVQQQAAFDALKQQLTTEGLALRRPDPQRRYVLHSDWSQLGIGAVLGQLDEQGREYMVACASRSLNRHESNYEPWKGELLALVYAVKHFRVYLWGTDFIAVTDHRPLLWMLTQREATGQLYRWILALQEYSFSVVHRDGVRHQNADALSRLPRASSADTTGARLDEAWDHVQQWLPKVAMRLGDTPVQLPVHCIPATLDQLRAAMERPWEGLPAAEQLAQPAAGPAVSLQQHQAALASSSAASTCVRGSAATQPPQPTAASASAAPAATAADPAQATGPTPVMQQRHPAAWAAALAHVSSTAAALRELADAAPADLDPPPLAVVPQLRSTVDQPCSPQREQAALLQAAASMCVSCALQQQILQVLPPPSSKLYGATGVDLTSVAPSFMASLPAGLVVLEVFGGLCACLEAALRAGWPVQAYLYVDSDPVAQAVARHRCGQLAWQYPELLPASALEGTFSKLPQCVYQCVQLDLPALVAAHPGQWLVGGGWECTDLSPAGCSRGLAGARSATYYPMLRLLGALQQACVRTQQPAPGYLLENVAFQFNWRSEQVATADFAEVLADLGEPMLLDAAQFGSYAHRLRNFWCNLISPAEMHQLCHVIQPPSRQRADDALQPGRLSAAVSRDDRSPYFPCNRRGKERVALPTILAYPGTRSTRPGRPGSIADLERGERDELTAAERERAMGYAPDTTAAPGVSEAQRCLILGRCIDMHTLSHVFALAAAVQRARAWRHPPAMRLLTSAAEPRTPPQPAASCGIASAMAGLAVESDLAVSSPPAEEQPQAEGDARQPDVWQDRAVLAYLQQQSMPLGLTAKEQARVAARASRYQWQQGQLHRRWAAGQLRLVPPPDQRLALVRRHHVELGHYGVKRTVFLLQVHHWWHGLTQMVKAYVAACSECGRSNACFNRVQPQLNPLPLAGPGFRWHLDLAGPFPTTSRSNRYVLVAIEAFTKYACLVAIPDKTPSSTAYAYAHAVYGHFGGCAQLVTDQGGEWEGEFSQLMQQLRVDHRHTSAYHPQANGQAEATVRTVKRSLQRLCTEATAKLEWDLQLPAVVLGYNCSLQSSTRLSPYQLMHGVTPMLPAQLRGVYAVTVDPSADQAADAYWQRAALLAKLGGVAWQNLLIAQHRDQLRYAKVRGGGYAPEVLQLHPGMLVYLKTQEPTGLSLPAQPTILQVVQVRPSGVVVLQGSDGNQCKRHASHCAPCHLPNVSTVINRQHQHSDDATFCVSCGSTGREEVLLLCDHCGEGHHTYCLEPPLDAVPEGVWLCPTCVATGITPQLVEQQQDEWEQQQREQRRQERVTPTIRQAIALDGRWVRHHQPGAKGWRGQISYGQLSFKGCEPGGGQPRLTVGYQDGHQEEITVRGVKTKYRQLLPEGEQPPATNAALAASVSAASVAAAAWQPQLQSSPLAELVQWVLGQPWRMRDVQQQQKVQEHLAEVLNPQRSAWATNIWLTSQLAPASQQAHQLCWWARLTVLHQHASLPPSDSAPLLLCADTGASLLELLELQRLVQAPVVICVVVPTLRPLQLEGLATITGVVAEPLGQQPHCCWAVWSFPAWQTLSWSTAQAWQQLHSDTQPELDQL